jgi:hypothetical protein
MIIMTSSSDDDAGGPGWCHLNGAAHSFAPANLDPLHHLSDDSLVEGILDACESTSSDSGSVDHEHLQGIRSHRLRRRTDAWAYPGDLLCSLEGKHVDESKNWRSLPPDELDRRWIAEFRMTEAVFLELLELVSLHLQPSVPQNVASQDIYAVHSQYIYCEREAAGYLELSCALPFSSADGDKMGYAT